MFATDEGFARTTAVALHSALRHLSPSTRFEVYVLDNGLTSASRERLRRVALAASGREIRWVEIPSDLLVHRPLEHLTATTYGRLLLPNLIPTSVNRVVYLDGDVLVKDDLTPLFQLEFGRASFAATRDFASPRADSESAAPDEPVEAKPFFNPGVLVANLTQWRTDGFAERALGYARTATEPLEFADQDAMNAVATADEWYELDLKWNVQVLLMYRPELPCTHLTDFLHRNREDIYRDAAVLHFNGFPKPWQPWSFGTSKGKTTWGLELVRSGWFERTESLKWAVPWLGRRFVNATRRAALRPSSSGP